MMIYLITKKAFLMTNTSSTFIYFHFCIASDTSAKNVEIFNLLQNIKSFCYKVQKIVFD